MDQGVELGMASQVVGSGCANDAATWRSYLVSLCAEQGKDEMLA